MADPRTIGKRVVRDLLPRRHFQPSREVHFRNERFLKPEQFVRHALLAWSADAASVQSWSLEQQVTFPISATITGNFAVVQYH